MKPGSLFSQVLKVGLCTLNFENLSKASSWGWDRVDEIFKWEGQNMHGPTTGMKSKVLEKGHCQNLNDTAQLSGNPALISQLPPVWQTLGLSAQSAWRLLESQHSITRVSLLLFALYYY